MAERLVLATNNPHKVEELSVILGGAGFELVTLDEAGLGGLAEPEETGETFLENARIKAAYYAAASGERCLADDSGLEVDALGGAPGVRSARYAGVEGPREARDAANNERLLRELEGVPIGERGARFVCVIVVCGADGGVIAEGRGAFGGEIAESARGENGFGYDPLLVITEAGDELRGKHAAELTAAEKHARSHRGAAAREVARALAERSRG
jgi:XTP/dITP diphosphohydrolase